MLVTTKWLTGLTILLSTLLLAGCAGKYASPKPGDEHVITGETFSFDQGVYPAENNLFQEYHIAPGDVLDVLYQVQSWKPQESFRIAVDHTVSIKFVHVPELNEEQNVQPNGKMSLPYVGEVSVVGLTVTELKKKIEDLYRKILRKPEVYVVVPEFSTNIKELKKDLHTSPRGLSRLVTVRPDGFVTFPMLGDIFVADHPVPEINKLMNERYEQVLPGLHVDLFLEKTTGTVIYVLGEVRKPGAYAIDKPKTVMEALALAGGADTHALLDNVIVFRRHDHKLVARGVNVQATLQQEGATFFALRPDDIVYIPKTRIGTLAQLMRDISDITFFNGYSITFDGILHNEPILGP